MKKALLVAALLGSTALAWAPLAEANVIASYSINSGVGGSGTLCSSATDTCSGTAAGTGSGAGVTINTLAVNSNSPGTSSLADLLGSTVNITNSGSSSVTIDLTLTGTGYTAPTAPPAEVLFSHVGGTVLTGAAANTLSYFSTAGGTSTAALTPSIVSNGSYNATNQIAIALLTAPFSMSETFAITLGGGSTLSPTSINFSSSSDLQPVPEPGSLALLGTALVGIAGVGFIRRRRRA